ncbi:MAG: DUF4199 domain-containing protein [Bacteroidaceae bacterium]|nr:DUF4199 domain-containing protein [Bacteroidaceae bacterium]
MNEKPTLTDAAGWMALPIGIMWSASFLCAMYGTKLPLLSMLGTALGIISIYMLYKQLTNYRRFFPSTGWLHVFRLSLLTCLLAGLLTDGVQYLYFAFLDQGRMLSVMSAAMQSEEYREVWKQLMPETDLKEVQEQIQSLTVRDIMLQMVIYNAFLAPVVALLAALPSRPPLTPPQGKKEEEQAPSL